MFPQLQGQDLGFLYNQVTTESTPNSTAPSTNLVPLGTVVWLGADNARRAYRYVLVGGTSTYVSGKLLVAAAAPSNSTGLALPTTNSTTQFSSGSRVLYVTNGVTTVTGNQFQDGVLEVLGTNGIGQSYRIAGNTADSVGSAQIEVDLVDGLRNTTALANGTNTVNLRVSSSNAPTTSTTQALPVGVTIMPVANTASVSYYGWVQVFGECYVAATSGTKGYPVQQDISTTAGNVINAGSGTTQPTFGIFKESASSTLASVYLQLI
jgi:hypothetical protein